MIVEATPPAAFAWLAERAGCVPSPGMRAIAAHDGHKIHGMAGFDGWTDNSVVVSIALDNPASFRSLVKPIFEYAFVQANRGVLLCTVRGTNSRSLKLCKRVGFREVYRIRDGVAVGEDLVVFEMRREECRWLDRKAA